MKEIALYSIFIVLTVAIQRAFLWGLPWPFNLANVILIFIVFVTVLNRSEHAAYIAGIAGFLLDLYSFMPFGVNIAALLLAAAAVQILSESLFTNRSLYSFVMLMIVSVFLFEGVRTVFHALSSTASQAGIYPVLRSFAANIWADLLVNAGTGTLVFYAAHYMSRRFKPVFIVKSRL